jgi:hypothetical protein
VQSFSAEGALSAEQSTLSTEQSAALSTEPSFSADPSSCADPSSSKKPFVPKPPRRCRIGIARKSKQSKYNYGAARVALNVPNANHFQIYSAAVSSNVNAINVVNPPTISPTKKEVKEERDMLYTIATDLERKLESSNKKIESLASLSLHGKMARSSELTPCQRR